MKKQVFVIHGGDSFPTYEEYISFLKDAPVNLDRYRGRDWKANLQDDLGKDFDVICPQMPNKNNAKYAEWKIWFDKIVNLLDQEIILVGHSMGGIFLAKYLSENEIDKKILAIFLVAAPYDMDGDREIIEFNLPKSLGGFEKQSGNIFIYHSKDDPIVDFSEFSKYQRALPNATTRVFEDRHHFIQEHLPEIIQDIKSLWKK